MWGDELFQKIDVDKLIQVLNKQQAALTALRKQDVIQSQQLQTMYKANKAELRDLNRRFTNENEVKNNAIYRLETMRQQMKALELNNGSVAAIWKEKCEELADICNELKDENEYLTGKTQQLAEVSVNLLSTLNEYHQVQAELTRLSEKPVRSAASRPEGALAEAPSSAPSSDQIWHDSWRA